MRFNLRLFGLKFEFNIPVLEKKWQRIALMIIFWLFILGTSWAFSALMTMAICWCFNVGFSLRISTGIWLSLILISSMFSTQQGE